MEPMNDRSGGAVDGAEPGSDYPIREIEARLDRRVTALEAQLDRLRTTVQLMGAGGAAVLIAFAFVLFTGGGDDQSRVTQSLVAQEVVLRDADGIVRARLGMDADGRTQFSLSDRDARARIRLTVLPDGSPGITISDADARPRAVLGYLPDGTTSLVLADAQGTSRAVVGLEPDGATHALFADESGAIRTLVGVAADGVPAVSTRGGQQSLTPQGAN